MSKTRLSTQIPIISRKWRLQVYILSIIFKAFPGDGKSEVHPP